MNGEGGRGKYVLYWPETGGIRLLLTIPLAYWLTSAATPIVLDEIELIAPRFVPEPVTTILAVLLWLLTGILVLTVARSELLLSVHRFESADDRSERVEPVAVLRRGGLVGLAMTIGGAVLVWVSFEEFLIEFRKLLELLVFVRGRFHWPFSVADGAWFALFLVGFGTVAVGLDRLVVNLLRLVIARRTG